MCGSQVCLTAILSAQWIDRLCRVVRSIRVSDQKEQWKHDAKAQIEIRRMIENVLKHIYEDQEEIPYIATYRKKSCGELLCLAADEVPNWTTQEEYK